MPNCAVYVMSCEGRTKIGISSDPARRRRGLEDGAGLPIDLITTRGFASRDAAGRVERELHLAFARYRTRGEWFTMDPDLAVTACGLH